MIDSSGVARNNNAVGNKGDTILILIRTTSVGCIQIRAALFNCGLT